MPISWKKINPAYQKYEDYLKENMYDICNYVELYYRKQEDYIRNYFTGWIKAMLNPLPKHYELMPREETPWLEHLEADGVLDTEQTVIEFFEEYTGAPGTPDEDGDETEYPTYGDVWEDKYSDTICYDIMEKAVRECIERDFSAKLSDEDMDNIRAACGQFDNVYELSLASSFFYAFFVAEYTGISDMKLSEILEK